MTRSPRQVGLVLLISVALFWGLNWPAMKVIVGEVPLWQFRAVTGIAGGALLFVIAYLLRQKLALPRRQWPALAAAAFCNVTSWFVLIAYGVKLMASGHTAIIGFTMPIWAALLGVVVLGESMTARRAASLALGTAGIVVLLSHDFAALGTSVWGAALTLLAAFNWGIGVLIQKRVKWAVEPVALAAWQITLGCVPICIIAAFLEPFVYHRASLAVILASVYVAFIALAFCYFAWFSVVRIFPAHVSAIGSLLTPIVGATSAALLLGEPFGWREMTALLLVVGAVALVLFQPQAPATATAAPGRTE
ncbi:MAG: DMT family transporter [Rhodospirillaceae bacterium]|nr:DMT family transporter [Rhodospirillaceae bacterium]